MTVTYFDSSAILKRSLQEAESDALADFLEGAPEGEAWVTSALGVVECHRALRRALPEPEVAEAADNALGDLVVIAITADVVRRASEMGDPTPRSLDAIHLATAEAAGATTMVTYDDRMGAAARGAGLAVVAPGPTTTRSAAKR